MKFLGLFLNPELISLQTQQLVAGHRPQSTL